MTETESASAALLRPFRLGALELENGLWQAPLAGYSSLPFRLLSWRWGRPGLLATEMISAMALKMQAPRQQRYLERSDEEGPVSYQLWGRDPEAVAEATRIVTDAGADVVDLNCGCPVRKVRAAGAGSKLMEDPPLVHRLVSAMRANTHLPVTAKIRVGTGASDMNGPEVAKAAAEAGADVVAVHGRHARESYATPVRYDQIARVVQAVSVPVVGNGDVRDGESAARMARETGCAGVMVGRGCMGAPWVFDKIKTELAGDAYAPPSTREVGRILWDHAVRLVDLLGEDLAVRHCRKLGSFYSKRMPRGRQFRESLNYCHSLDDLGALIDDVFGPREKDAEI